MGLEKALEKAADALTGTDGEHGGQGYLERSSQEIDPVTQGLAQRGIFRMTEDGNYVEPGPEEELPDVSRPASEAGYAGD